MRRFRRSRPQNKWLRDFILSNNEKSSRHKGEGLKVLKHVSGPHADGSLVREVTDSDVYMNAVFTKTAVEEAQSDNEDSMQPDWDRALILVTKCHLDFKFEPHQASSGFVIVIEAFKIWDFQIGFHLKNKIIHYLEDTNIAAKVKKLWEEENTRLMEEGVVFDNVSGSPMSLTQLLGQMSPSESQVTCSPKKSVASPSEARDPSRPSGPTGEGASKSDLTRAEFTINELLIPQKEGKKLEQIAEWKEDYIPTQSSGSDSMRFYADNVCINIQRNSLELNKAGDMCSEHDIETQIGYLGLTLTNISGKELIHRKEKLVQRRIFDPESGHEHEEGAPAVHTDTHNLVNEMANSSIQEPQSQAEENSLDSSLGQPSIHLTCSDTQDSQPSQLDSQAMSQNCQAISQDNSRTFSQDNSCAVYQDNSQAINQDNSQAVNQDNSQTVNQVDAQAVSCDGCQASQSTNVDSMCIEEVTESQQQQQQKTKNGHTCSKERVNMHEDSNGNPANGSKQHVRIQEPGEEGVSDQMPCESQGFIPEICTNQSVDRSRYTHNSSSKFGPTPDEIYGDSGTMPFVPNLNTQEIQQLKSHVYPEDYLGTCPFSPNLSPSGEVSFGCVNETVGSNTSVQEEGVIKSSGESNNSLMQHFDLSPIVASGSGDCTNHTRLTRTEEEREGERIQRLSHVTGNFSSLESPRLARLASPTRMRDSHGDDDAEEIQEEEHVGKDSRTGRASRRDKRKRSTETDSQIEDSDRKRLKNDGVSDNTEVEEERRSSVDRLNTSLDRMDNSETEVIEDSEKDQRGKGGILASVINPVMRLFRRRPHQTEDSPSPAEPPWREGSLVKSTSSETNIKNKDIPVNHKESSPEKSGEVTSSEESVKILAPRQRPVSAISHPSTCREGQGSGSGDSESVVVISSSSEEVCTVEGNSQGNDAATEIPSNNLRDSAVNDTLSPEQSHTSGVSTENVEELLNELLNIQPKTETGRKLMSLTFPKGIMKAIYKSYSKKI